MELKEKIEKLEKESKDIIKLSDITSQLKESNINKREVGKIGDDKIFEKGGR